MSSYAQVASLPVVPATFPATSKMITKDLSVDQTCAVLQTIVGLGDCIPAIRKHNVDGRQLLECTEKEFISMLQSERILAFQGRTKWKELRPHMQYSVHPPVAGVDKLAPLQRVRHSSNACVRRRIMMRPLMHSSKVIRTFASAAFVGIATSITSTCTIRTGTSSYPVFVSCFDQ